MTITRIYYFYIVRCNDNSLYSGITTDLVRRVDEHNTKKKGAKYTRAKGPVNLVYFERFISRTSASKREWQVKKMSKKQKELLINKKIIQKN